MISQSENPKNHIAARDWEALSAYLDGALNNRQQAQVKARLAQEADLQGAFQELRRTRMVLRSQPRMRVPRNFTLTPQMAGVHTGKRSQPFAYPVLRLATVLATIFLVVAVVGEVVGRSAKPAIVAQSPGELAAPWAGGMGGGGGGSDNEVGMDSQLKEVAVTSEAALAPAAEATTSVELRATLTSTPTPGSAATLIAGVPEAELSPVDKVESGTQPASDYLAWPLLRILQILLALLAVISGVGAWYFRRQARS